LVVVADKEPRPAIAELADAVEQDHGFAGVEERGGGWAGV
jgi:hypothetical protein